MNKKVPFIETPQGIFIENAGWLRITPEFLDNSYSKLWEIREKSEVYLEINEWASAFGFFPAFILLPLLLILPLGLVALLGLGFLTLIITQHKFLYGLHLSSFITLFNKHFVQVAFALAVFSILGMKGMYIELTFAVIVFFSARIGWVKWIAEWIGDRVFQQKFRYEQFLMWICIQKSLSADLPVAELSEMKEKLQKVMPKKKF
jgi:uncharacterized membrane protein